jgi:hypothetical protein
MMKKYDFGEDVYNLKYSPNGKFIVTIHSNGCINFWKNDVYHEMKWKNAKIVFEIRFNSHGTFKKAFSVWNIMVRTLLYIQKC